jgi:hypothetical protein
MYSDKPSEIPRKNPFPSLDSMSCYACGKDAVQITSDERHDTWIAWCREHARTLSA